MIRGSREWEGEPWRGERGEWNQGVAGAPWSPERGADPLRVGGSRIRSGGEPMMNEPRGYRARRELYSPVGDSDHYGGGRWFDEAAELEPILRRISGAQHLSGGYRGLAPKGYRRSRIRIEEDIQSLLSGAPDLDASEIEVLVSESNEVVLRGSVEDRSAKREAEDLVESVLGVVDVCNELRISPRGDIGSLM